MMVCFSILIGLTRGQQHDNKSHYSQASFGQEIAQNNVQQSSFNEFYDQAIQQEISNSEQTFNYQRQNKDFKNEKRQMNVQYTDPCYVYSDPDTKLMCTTCITDSSKIVGYIGPPINSSYYYASFILSPNVVHCAIVDLINEIKNIAPNSPSVCSVISVQLYQGISSTVHDIMTYYLNNTDSYKDIILGNQSPTNPYKTVCLNQYLYYTRTALYTTPFPSKCPFKTDYTTYKLVETQSSESASYCSLFKATGNDDYDYNTLNYLSRILQCFQCYSAGNGLYTAQKLRYWPEFNIYSVDCFPRTGIDTCGKSSSSSTDKFCALTQFKLTPTNGSAPVCIDCKQNNNPNYTFLSTQCISCSNITCNLCRAGFFYSNKGHYLYAPNGSDQPGKRQTTCIFDYCEEGMCKSYDSQTCVKAADNMKNCLKCSQNLKFQNCSLCKAGFIPSSDGTSCQALQKEVTTIMFVNATSHISRLKSCPKNPKTTFNISNPGIGDDDYAKINPTDIINPSPFIQHAWRAIQKLGDQYQKVTATIYLGKGQHFFFSCTGREDSAFSLSANDCLYNYCLKLDLYRHYSQNDNYDIQILPLECSLKQSFGFQTTNQNEAFDKICIDLKKDGKPIVFVNNAKSYFNVTGKLTIKNIDFSGINGVVTYKSSVDLTVLPQLYCSIPNEPNGLLDPTVTSAEINPDTQIQKYTQVDKNITTFSFDCPLYATTDNQVQKPPTSSNLQDACQSYSGEQVKMEKKFPSTYQSTKGCLGEPVSSDYFFTNQFGHYYSRRRTLFNIYSFGEHVSNRNQTPELIIENSQFEYFLATGYESLITIETYVLTKSTFNDIRYAAGQSGNNFNIYTRTYFTYNGADRGAKIQITNSIFKHSRFCRGLIYYRPSQYISQNMMRTLINETNLYMNQTIKNNSDSYIIVKGSTFTNLNAYSKVLALSVLGSTYDISSTGMLDYVTQKYSQNMGIVLNIEDFGGRVELVDSNFNKNFHYIPSILYTGQAKADLVINDFLDSDKNELYFTSCNQKTDSYFFGSSQMMTSSYEPDLDQMFDTYESMSLIFISRPLDLTLIKGCTFSQNIGTFGAAVTINSPNWQKGNQPHVVLSKNTFENNMAYLSGNAVYIKLSMIKNGMNASQICAGVNIIGNTFYQNIGMKVHNGGAISAHCLYIDLSSHPDYYSTSNYTNDTSQISSSAFFNSSYMTITSQADSQIIGIEKNIFNIRGNQFLENYSGMKGTAIYLKQISSVRLYDNSFEKNGPVYSIAELQFSPYKRFFSGRTITFYDPDCIDEFEYLQKCNNNFDGISQFGGIQWPNIKGALYIESCQTEFCFSSNITQEIEINYNTFQQNIAGPILDFIQDSTASQIYIIGGQNFSIKNSLFNDNKGSNYIFDQMDQRKLANYFPPKYFEYSNSPLINIILDPPSKLKKDINITFNISNTQFLKSKNIQVLGVSDTNQYRGSIINIENLQKIKPTRSQLLLLNIEDSIIQDNQFIGVNSALIYSNKILTQIIRTKFIKNGRYYYGTPTFQSFSDDKDKYVTSDQFSFKDISHNDIQQNGCIYIVGSYKFPYNKTHQFIRNIFSYNFAYQGAAYSFNGLDFQQVNMAQNKYTMLAAMKGSILYWVQNTNIATIRMQNESAHMIIGGLEGAISINPTTNRLNHIFIYDSNFTSVYASQGSAISLQFVGKLYLQNCLFDQAATQFKSNQEKIKYFLSQFSSISYTTTTYFIDDKLLSSLLSNFPPKTGFIDLREIYKEPQTEILNIIFKGITLQSSFNNPDFAYSEIINCNFLNNYAYSFAAVYGYKSRIKILNKPNQNQKTRQSYLIANNNITELGAIGIEGGENADLVLENVQFINNTAKNKASALYISQSTAHLKSTLFTGNKAFEAGTVVIEGNSFLECNNCTFQDNWADDSSAIYAQNNVQNFSVFNNSRFINNRATANLMNILYSYVSIYNTLFLNNIAQEVNHGITLIGARAQFSNITVNYTDLLFLNSEDYNVDTGFFNLNYRSVMNISNSTIQNTRGSIGSVITVTGGSSLCIDKNSTIKNCRSLNGDVIRSSMAKYVNILNTTFQDNSERDIYLDQTPSLIQNSKFINSKSNSIYVDSSYTVMIGNLFQDTIMSTSDIRSKMTPQIISDLTNLQQQPGKGLFCRCNDESIIANNTFRGLSAQQGAALFLTSDTLTNSPLYKVKYNVFDSNFGINGPAVYLENGNILMKSNQMLFNRGVVGGSVYLSCYDTVKSINYNLINQTAKAVDQDGIPDYFIRTIYDDSLKCNVQFLGSNIFLQNSADDGGAIKWTKNRPLLVNTTKFINNTATVYANDIASYPKSVQLVFLQNGDYLNRYNQSESNINLTNKSSSNSSTSGSNPYLKMVQTNKSSSIPKPSNDDTEIIGYIPPLVSGNKIDFNVFILDQDGNIYTSDSDSKASLDNKKNGLSSQSKNNTGSGQLVVDSKKALNSSSSPITDVILLNNTVVANNGVYQFRGVELRADPGSKPTLDLAFSGLQTFGNQIPFASTPIIINTTVRKCIAGEELTKDGRCLACPEGQFQFSTPTEPVSCKKCLANAECKGKMTVYPKVGMWRSSNISENFITCPNTQVCLGGDADNPQGKCAIGYQGIICGDCAANYSKSKQFECGMCPPRIRNIVQTTFIMVGMAGYIAFLVRGTLLSADQQKSVTSVYMKILTNHIQILGAISNVDIQFPSQIQKFQESQSTVTSASGQIFSFDCFLMGDDGIDDGIPVFFQKLMMYGLQPVLLLLVCIAFWGIVGKVKNYSKEEFRGKLISTMIVVLFLVHPDIAKIMFSSFNCIQVDDNFRMKDNIRSICYKGEHMFYTSIVAFPSIAVWVMGIPFFAFIVLYRNRRVINLMGKKRITEAEKQEIIQLKMKYGFLFSGYESRAYFWEIIIMYRKILLIGTSVFLSTVSPESQVLVVIFVIIINMMMQTQFAPFTTSTLNKMESYSLYVAAVTIYTGMYYVTGKNYSYMKIDGVSWFFLVCIALPNVIFLGYWGLSMRLEVLKTIWKIHKEKNMKPWIFKVLAFTSSEAFYEAHVRKDEEYAEETRQIIVDENDIALEETDKDGNPIKLKHINLEIKEIPNFEDTMMKMEGKNRSLYTIDDMTVDPQNITHDELLEFENRLKSKDRKKRYRNNSKSKVDKVTSSPNTARSHKVHPESFAEKQGDEFTNISEIYNFKDPINDPHGPDNYKEFTLNNDELQLQLKKAMQSSRHKKKYVHIKDPSSSRRLEESSRDKSYPSGATDSAMKPMMDYDKLKSIGKKKIANIVKVSDDDAQSIGEIDIESDDQGKHLEMDQIPDIEEEKEVRHRSSSKRDKKRKNMHLKEEIPQFSSMDEDMRRSHLQRRRDRKTQGLAKEKKNKSSSPDKTKETPEERAYRHEQRRIRKANEAALIGKAKSKDDQGDIKRSLSKKRDKKPRQKIQSPIRSSSRTKRERSGEDTIRKLKYQGGNQVKEKMPDESRE